MHATEAELKDLMAAVFGVEPSRIGEDASVDTVEEWDSLRQLNLVLALEERFAITLTEQEAIEILSYPLVRAVLEEHGIRIAREQ